MGKIFLSLCICISINGIKAQTYQVTTFNEPFVFLDNAESAFTGPWDTPEFQLPLGFNFDFFNITTDTLYSITNSFGADFELNQDTAHLYTLFPFLASLIDRGYQQDSALSPINYKTEGIAGQRIFTLEYVEAGLFDGLQTKNGVFLDYINFQVKLYEGSGNIEFHIGPYSIEEEAELVFSSNIFCSIPGPLIGLVADAESHPGGHIGELILLTGDPVNPTIVTDAPECLEWPIPENTVYRFSRKVMSVDDGLHNVNQTLLYPNPTFGDLSLLEADSKEIIYPIIVMDALGKKVTLWNSEPEISAIGLSKGCYYVTVSTKTKVVTQKLIVLSQ